MIIHDCSYYARRAEIMEQLDEIVAALLHEDAIQEELLQHALRTKTPWTDVRTGITYFSREEQTLMPRIYDSASNPLDFCKRCFPSELEAEEVYGDIAKTGEGPDDRGNCFGWEAEHPDYEGEEYSCEECGKPLTEEDN